MTIIIYAVALIRLSAARQCLAFLLIVYGLDSHQTVTRSALSARMDYAAPCEVSPPSQDEGAMFRDEPCHTGVFDTAAVAKLHGIKWRFKTGKVIEAWFSSPVSRNGMVYFGADDGFIYAVDARSGDEEWRFRTGDVVYSSPAVSDTAVFCGSHDGYFYALDIKTGSEKWRFKTGYRIYSSPTIMKGTVYFGSADTYFYAVDALTGELKWSFKTGSWVASSAAVCGGTVFFGSWDHYL